MPFCSSQIILAAAEHLHDFIHHPSSSSNFTCRNWEAEARSPNNENNNTDDLKMLFLHFLFPMVLVAMIINIWLGFVRPWEYHRHDDAQNTTATTAYCEYYEDWLLLNDGDAESEGLLRPTRYNGVKESPLSPEEVDRLTRPIFADDDEEEIPRSADRKRKATGGDSPVSDVSTDGGSVSPRTRKLKIETDFGVDQKWVGEVSDDESCVREENEFDQDSGFPSRRRSMH
ncbi:MAG: hypothetical protein Q9216_006006 [Gyalolechia sp. 2 TL-2023]